jgi:hypothetical protein
MESSKLIIQQTCVEMAKVLYIHVPVSKDITRLASTSLALLAMCKYGVSTWGIWGNTNPVPISYQFQSPQVSVLASYQPKISPEPRYLSATKVVWKF